MYFRFRKKERVPYDSVLEGISSSNEIRADNTSENKAYKWLNDDTVVSSPSDSFLVQRYILMVLHYSVKGENSINVNKWGSDKNECEWIGVEFECDRSCKPCKNEARNVILINLSTSLSERLIPNEVGYLSQLEELDLSSNDLLRKNLSSSIFTIRSSERCVMYGQWFDYLCCFFCILILVSCNINVLILCFTFITEYYRVKLSSCALMSVISLSINNISSLLELNIGSNMFIDSGVGAIKCLPSILETLILSNNEFSWTIPIVITSLTKLKHLDISSNDFKGIIYTTFGKLAKVELLDLSKTELESTLPVQLGELSKLTNINFLMILTWRVQYHRKWVT